MLRLRKGDGCEGCVKVSQIFGKAGRCDGCVKPRLRLRKVTLWLRLCYDYVKTGRDLARARMGTRFYIQW